MNSRCFFTLFILMELSNILLAQSVSISPSRVFLTGEAAQELSQQIILSNPSDNPVIFTSSFKDWKRDSIGEKHYFAPNTMPLSNASWVEVTPNVVTIPAKSSVNITIGMHVPSVLPNKNAVTNSMLFLTQINEQQAKLKTGGANPKIGVSVKLEFGIHVYFTPQGTVNKNLDFVAVDYKGQQTINNKKTRRIAVKIKNTGNVVTDGFLRFDITNQVTGDEVKIDPKAISMMPGDEQIIYTDLPVTLKGKYVLVALLDGGEETSLKVAKKELEFTD
ncbi:MAG: hypothetical protein EOP47_29500 [Sphingobacteriaceae bacterium]|nr:MAG: hypothetical protein EOP47_29500 [Sphingobacteriaceae bacterium]